MQPKKPPTKSKFLLRCNHFQWVLLFLNIAIITIGACDLGLSFASRPMLRLINVKHKEDTRIVLDVMVAAGFVQIVVASLDILTTCSKRTRYLYFSITASILAVLLELASLIAALYILGEGTLILSQDILQPWFLWECVPHGSCENGLLYHINFFMMPQVGLTALAIVLHGLSILYLMKLFRAKKFHLSELWRAKERAQGRLKDNGEIETHEEVTHPGFAQAFSSDNNNPSECDKDSDASDSDPVDDDNDGIELLERRRGSQPDLVNRTPVSILKDSNSESVCSRRTIGSNARRPPQSLTFSTNVEIHLMNSPKTPEGYSSTAF